MINKEDYVNQKNDLLKKRLALFKKMHKIDAKIKKLDEDYVLDSVPVKKGDKYIVTSKATKDSVRIRVNKVVLSNDNKLSVLVYFDSMTAKWRKQRAMYGSVTDGVISLYQKNNYKFPENYFIWDKVEDI